MNLAYWVAVGRYKGRSVKEIRGRERERERER